MKPKWIFPLALVFLSLGWFYFLGKGSLGGPWKAQEVSAGPRPQQDSESFKNNQTQILFGDLHAHTSLSLDAYIFSTDLIKGGGVVTPEDACDFARYCSALDFWSINDHAESLTPRVWADTIEAIRSCNENAGNRDQPDMVSFLGWEWSQSFKADPQKHYGHKNVIFRTWEDTVAPTRPIAAPPKKGSRGLESLPSTLLGVLSIFDGVSSISDLAYYLNETKSTPVCPDGVSSRELSVDCREIAATPQSLYKKLEEWGFDSLVIPHGLAWGITNPLGGDFRTQMDQHQDRYHRLLEIYSGHGNSERFEDFQRIERAEDGTLVCPDSTENFTPCCRQAGILARKQCDDPESSQCERHVADVEQEFLAAGFPKGRSLFKDSLPEDWAGCGQLRNSFQPSSAYVPRLSAQYSLALGFDSEGRAKRAKFGLIGSSDSHQGRPGSSYKERNRLLYTDSKSTGKKVVDIGLMPIDKESGGFYYTGGLVAVHADGRDRDSIWRALTNRNTYATSGGRMMVWFDLMNGPYGAATMGSEVLMQDNPRFKLRALGEFSQRPGCPDYAVAALGQERTGTLCGGECYYPAGERRRAIERVEIIRIRPQMRPDEKIAPLIEDNWRVFGCPADGNGCEVEFEDPDYSDSKRSALYYARVIQEAEPLINGDPFGCEYDSQGECVKQNYCIEENSEPGMDCLSEAEPRAWTSPIFIEYDGSTTGDNRPGTNLYEDN